MEICTHWTEDHTCDKQKNCPAVNCGGKFSECNIAQNTDNVNHPSHYNNGKVECIDALEAATVGLNGIEAICTANAIKYLWRWKYKNGTEDLKKAIWYIDYLITHTMDKKD